MMVELNSPELKHICSLLKKYNLQSTVTQLAGLLTVPSLQANTLRIETLIHLAVANCRGRRKPGLIQLGHWLNRQFEKKQILRLEDPVEDVFVTNIETPEGNRRIFEGIWNSNDYFLQTVIDVLGSSGTPQECQVLLRPAFALLQLSDLVTERVGLPRWHTETSTPRSKVKLAPATRVTERARAVTFTNSELDRLNINYDELAPFIIRDEDWRRIISETIGHTSLERHPLLEVGGGKLVLTLPHAVSPAIRRFILSEILRMGYLPPFSHALATYQANQIEMDGLMELKTDSESLTPPTHDGTVPPLTSILLKYDINKYLHIILLHDRLDWLDTQGLSSFVDYSEEIEAGLEEYVNKVADHCKSLPDFSEGMTLLVLCGLGRGFRLGFKNWPNQWRLSAICISNLLMLANESDRPITRYLKYIKQKELVESEGVSFSIITGDYDLYCYWRQSNCQLVPRALSLGPESMLSVNSDFILPVRNEVRSLMDRHVVQTTTGIYTPVIRINSRSYFSSLSDRPIYGSLAHVRSEILAGVVETTRGPRWFVVTLREGNQRVSDFLYQIWNGFINLYDQLVSATESQYPNISIGVIKICLDFSDVLMPEDYTKVQSDMIVGEPEVLINLERQNAIVKFPPYFLQHFMQPENTGERLLLRSIAKGLVCLHKRTDKNFEESILDTLIGKVIKNPSLRILHGFIRYDAVEHLQEKKNLDPVFLAQEDFVFSKLKLSENCTSNPTDISITSKTECNKFLHCVVEKLWKQLLEQLQGLDRASVIREMLLVNEAIIRDRDHWKHTARALQALSASTDDIQSVAQKRESDRAVAGLSSRTILEMAICESPEAGARQLSRWELDDMLAKTILLLEVTTHSDAVYNDLVEPKIDLHPNGEYTINRDFKKTVIEPFLTAYHQEKFERAVAEYSKLYRNNPPEQQVEVDELFSSEFIYAFEVEFGLTLDEVKDGIAELLEMAVECDSVIVETTFGNIKTRLSTNRGFSLEVNDAFVRTFGLFHRPIWGTPPEGFKRKDIYPWRYSRSLSFMVKPLLIFGKKDADKVLFGVGTLQQGFMYLLDRAENGRLPQDFFTSAEMRQYIGETNNKRGHAFAQSIAIRLSEQGWLIRNEVKMTELGAPAKLGDIDVLAWKPTGEILVVECKRLQLARTLAEIAEICRRFSGEVKDELGKHLQRVHWLKANYKRLEPIVGFEPKQKMIDDRLITNTQVPMTYLTSLPIDAEKIGPLEKPRNMSPDE